MKKQFLSAIFIFIAEFITAADPTRCECGAHATGITTYTVNGKGCCDGNPISEGVIYTYTLNQGVWQLSGTTCISGSQTQKRCFVEA
jgi:hypothetical protein